MSDTLFYIVVFVIIAHFVAGIGFLVYKLGGPAGKDPADRPRAKPSAGHKNRGTQ